MSRLNPESQQLQCWEYVNYYKRLNFNMGSAVKYRWRQGTKDGEPLEKDSAKAMHYITFEAKCRNMDWHGIDKYANCLIEEAKNWDGDPDTLAY